MEKLEEINLSDRKIDPKIANLVRRLTSIKVDTDASCEGHLDDNRHHHPWVGINPFQYAKIDALKMLLKRYNQEADVKWRCAVSWVVPKDTSNCPICHRNATPRTTEEELRLLQKSSGSLALFLFDHREDEKIQDLLANRSW